MINLSRQYVQQMAKANGMSVDEWVARLPGGFSVADGPPVDAETQAIEKRRQQLGRGNGRR